MKSPTCRPYGPRAIPTFTYCNNLYLGCLPLIRAHQDNAGPIWIHATAYIRGAYLRKLWDKRRQNTACAIKTVTVPF